MRTSAILSLAALSTSAATAQAPCLGPTQVLTARAPVTTSLFGAAAALDGDRAFVANTIADPAILAVMEKDVALGTWHQVQLVTVPTSVTSLITGPRVALEGDLGLIGLGDAGGYFRRVHVLERDPATGAWSILQAMAPPSTFPTDLFGSALGISGEDLLIVSEEENAIQVWRRSSPGAPFALAELVTPPPHLGVEFGDALVVDGDRMAAVDDLGTVMIFERTGAGDWLFVESVDLGFTSPTQRIWNSALVFDDDLLAVGVTRSAASAGGHVEVLRRRSGGWASEARIDADDVGADWSFGWFLVGSDETLVVGGGADTCGPSLDTAWALRNDGTSGRWVIDGTLCPADHGAEDFFVPLAYEGETLVLGDTTVDVGANTLGGAAFFIPLLSGAADCDGDCTADGDEIAACVGCDLNGNGRLDRCEGLGRAFCDPGAPNVTGAAGQLSAIGTGAHDVADIRVEASSLPPGSPGMLLSAASLSSPASPGGTGTLCLGASGFGRHLDTVGATLIDGTLPFMLDPRAIPAPGGTASAAPGSTWFFQVWYRDGAGSNLTEALAISFE